MRKKNIVLSLAFCIALAGSSVASQGAKFTYDFDLTDMPRTGGNLMLIYEGPQHEDGKILWREGVTTPESEVESGKYSKFKIIRQGTRDDFPCSNVYTKKPLEFDISNHETVKFTIKYNKESGEYICTSDGGR